MIYTGKTRLARNLLQNVIRNWYARQPAIVSNVLALKDNAEACAAAFRAEDLAQVGKVWMDRAAGCKLRSASLKLCAY